MKTTKEVYELGTQNLCAIQAIALEANEFCKKEDFKQAHAKWQMAISELKQFIHNFELKTKQVDKKKVKVLTAAVLVLKNSKDLLKQMQKY